ncbi:MAG: hypothetical protein RIQ41_402 [Candidatus Parcubacteria bacterium]|jgi:hypothetical protein
MAIHQPQSPLDSIPDLEPLSDEAVQRILDRHERVVLPKILEQERERIQAAHEFRKKVLF